MDATKPVAEAVAVKKNKIIKVGSNQEITQLIGKNTKVIRLEGKTVVPGLIDTHVHVADFGRCLMWLDLTTAKSIKELQVILKEKVKQTPKGHWIIGRGWNDCRFKEKRFLNLSDLDAATPDHPVILYHEAAMICAVNSKALELAGVTGQTVVPSGGAIDRNEKSGEIVGILRESATNLVWQAVPEPTENELLDAAALACQKIVEGGLTSVHWLVLSERELSIIKRLNSQEKLLVRVNVVIPEEFFEKTKGLKSDDNLHYGGVLIVVDGYLDSKEAALVRPYVDDPENYGTLLFNNNALAASVARVIEAGFQPVIQAMGDKAINLVLTVIKQAEETSVGKATRFCIEQAALLNPSLIRRLKNQKVVVSVQPKVIATEFSVWSATKNLGDDRAKWLHPLKTLFEVGVKVAGGSDCPMEPLSPLLGIQAAVTRQVFPEQSLNVEEALKMYSIDAAYSSCDEKIKGSIEEGKLADFTILSGDPFAVACDKIETIKVEMTVINGKVIFS